MKKVIIEVARESKAIGVGRLTFDEATGKVSQEEWVGERIEQGVDAFDSERFEQVGELGGGIDGVVRDMDTLPGVDEKIDELLIEMVSKFGNLSSVAWGYDTENPTATSWWLMAFA